MNNKYHIDVSPEEDALFQDKLPQNNKNKKVEYSLFKNWIFWSVLAIHLGIFSIFAVASPKKETTQQQEPPTTKKEKPAPSSTPSNDVPMDNKPEPLKEVKPQTSEIKPTPPQIKPEIKNQMTKEYVVKAGDTIFSIAKKYKLNYDRLIKMNNIQDPDKVVVGQKLRFL